MGLEKRIFYKESITKMAERMSASSSWFPYPAILSFSLCLVFIGHLLLGINPRLGNPAELLEIDGSKSEEGSIWLSLSLNPDGFLIVTTADRKVIQWKNFEDKKAQDHLKIHLQKQVQNLLLSASLEKKIFKIQTMVIFALDQSLTFYHIRPLLYILAQIGISDYGFETRSPVNLDREKK